MAEKLKVNPGSDIGKILWRKHQEDEYLRVDDYKEAMCFGCFRNRAVAATIVDICGTCLEKKGKETILARIKQNYYGYCYFCNTYQFGLHQLNVRVCESCHYRIKTYLKEFNKKGGMFGVDPYWKHIRKKHGKDWKRIMFEADQAWIKKL